MLGGKIIDWEVSFGAALIVSVVFVEVLPQYGNPRVRFGACTLRIPIYVLRNDLFHVRIDGR